MGSQRGAEAARQTQMRSGGMRDEGRARVECGVGWDDALLVVAVASRRDTFPLSQRMRPARCSSRASSSPGLLARRWGDREECIQAEVFAASFRRWPSLSIPRPQTAPTPGSLSFVGHALQSKPAMFSVARKSILRQARTQLRLSQPATVPQYSAFARLLSTLAVLEQRDGKLNPASLSAISAGTKLGGSITAFVAGSGVKSVADEAAKIKGIEKIIYVENDAYEKVRAAIAQRLLLLTTTPGSARELRSAASGEHQEGRILTYPRWTLSIRKEPPTSRGCAPGRAGHLRHYCD